MMHPLFGDTVTLYQPNGIAWTRTILQGVQWRQRVERTASADGVLHVQTVTSVTIPPEQYPAGGISAAGQDVMVPGTGPQITGAYTLADLKRAYPGYCTVRAVRDNTMRPGLKHWKVTAT